MFATQVAPATKQYNPVRTLRLCGNARNTMTWTGNESKTGSNDIYGSTRLIVKDSVLIKRSPSSDI
jgi:hypothetical protein